MTMIVVLFNLKSESKQAEYEQWARTTDIPTAGGLPSVDNFEVLRSVGILGSDAKPPYKYIELLKVNDMEKLTQDIATETMQRVAEEFRGFADNPLFILTENL